MGILQQLILWHTIHHRLTTPITVAQHAAQVMTPVALQHANIPLSTPTRKLSLMRPPRFPIIHTSGSSLICGCETNVGPPLLYPVEWEHVSDLRGKHYTAVNSKFTRKLDVPAARTHFTSRCNKRVTLWHSAAALHSLRRAYADMVGPPLPGREYTDVQEGTKGISPSGPVSSHLQTLLQRESRASDHEGTLWVVKAKRRESHSKAAEIEERVRIPTSDAARTLVGSVGQQSIKSGLSEYEELQAILSGDDYGDDLSYTAPVLCEAETAHSSVENETYVPLLRRTDFLAQHSLKRQRVQCECEARNNSCTGADAEVREQAYPTQRNVITWPSREAVDAKDTSGLPSTREFSGNWGEECVATSVNASSVASPRQRQLEATPSQLIVDPIQWLSQSIDAPLADVEVLNERPPLEPHSFPYRGAKAADGKSCEDVTAGMEGDCLLSASPRHAVNEVDGHEKVNKSDPYDQGCYTEYGTAQACFDRSLPLLDEECDASTNSSEEMTLVYNIFTRRVAKSNSASIRSLALLGISVNKETRQLELTNRDTLLQLAAQMRQKELSWPKMWSNSSLHRQVKGILSDTRIDDPAERVQGLLRMHYNQIHRRPGTGVLVGAENTGGGGDSLPSTLLRSVQEANSDKLLSLSDLNEEQQQVVHFVLKGYNTYIGGGAGTGKSVLLRVLRQQLIKEGLTVAVTATTGVASCQIGGCTLHHCFGITMHGEFTRRKELAAYDVIIVDEVSMLSREIFEALERQLRRANGVDLPFGGVQMVLCGDFLQLGAIASKPLIASPIFRRYFAMLKLHTVVRQNRNAAFAQQLQELRRGIVPADLHSTVNMLTMARGSREHQLGIALKDRQLAQLKLLDGELRMESNDLANMEADASYSPSVEHRVSNEVTINASGTVMEEEHATTYVDGAINLLPTNKQVEETNRRELTKLPGDVTTFSPQICAPTLIGRWSATFVLRVNACAKMDRARITHAIEQYVHAFVKHSEAAPAWATEVLRLCHIVMYPLFVDAFVLRVRVPADFEEAEAQLFLNYIGSIDHYLEKTDVGVRVCDVIEEADGTHTEADEYLLEQYAARSPMAQPLNLKIGARVMLRVNLASGLVNGTLGTVVGFRKLSVDDFPRHMLGNPQREHAMRSYADFLCFEQGFSSAIVPEVNFDGKIEVIPPVTHFVGGLSNTHHFSMGIVSLPLTLAYAFTVHKVQGLTLVGRVHLELSRMWPCEHLLYVAMSRVRNPDQLSISNFDEKLVQVASDCLLYDDSLPSIDAVRVPAYLFQATWVRTPNRRKKVMRQKSLERKKAGRIAKRRSTSGKLDTWTEERIHAIQQAILEERTAADAAK